jgi:hypothetical protein
MQCLQGLWVLAAGVVTMSKTMRLLAALPTTQKRLTFEMEICLFGEKRQDRYLSNNNNNKRN